jgi:hypothetical protein
VTVGVNTSGFVAGMREAAGLLAARAALAVAARITGPSLRRVRRDGTRR